MNLSCKAYSKVACFFADKSGVTAIEYAVIGVAMATLLYNIFGSDGTFNSALTSAFTTITNRLK